MATATATGSSREARRRRISERGSDRLALITGRIQSLSPDPDLSPAATRPMDRTPFGSSHRDDPSHLHCHSGRELSQCDDGVAEVEPLLHDGSRGKNIASTAAGLPGEEEPNFQAPPSVQSIYTDRDRRHEYRIQRNPLTAGKIISAISASESVRTRCAVAAALLVILHHIGLPTLGRGVIGTTIFFRPLYLLLLTNVNIVLARLLFEEHGVDMRTGQTNRVTSSGENGLVDQLGRALESGLVLQNIFGALFMDFSIYAVLLICGLPLIR